MPLVENCFKHVSQYTDKENKIIIRYRFENGWFYFETINTTAFLGGDIQPGIGIDNVKKRLDLVYPGRYFLEVKNTGVLFNMSLKIKI